MAKHVFVTGGVVSSLGKGLTAASIGMLLKNRGLRVAMQKFDPYINVDPGTMNPFQHGEVFVTDDGAETDLDLGHYERFTGETTTRASNVTQGSIYLRVIEKERRGDYLGETVQIVPHITDEIKSRMRALAKPGIDVVISEIGGTVGDIEGLPFLEAIRQFTLEVGRANVITIHLTLLPHLKATDEVKTKPTQHSVGKLREIGLQPDVIICRTEKSVSDEVRKKIALFCSVEIPSVLEEKDVDFSIYEVPAVLHRQGLDDIIVNRLNLDAEDADLSLWKEMLEVIRQPKHSVDVALVGKYTDLADSYKSIFEALTHGGIANHTRVRVRQVSAERIYDEGPEGLLAGFSGVIVPGGFGERGIEGIIRAIEHVRVERIPYFGICLGMQCACIEFARNVIEKEDAHSTEIKPDTPHPVICLLSEQKSVTKKGGSMRLGAYPCRIAKGTKAREAYGHPEVFERHRHRYEFNPAYRMDFEEGGVTLSGVSPDGTLVEMIELGDHPWFLGTQFHPEFRSRPDMAHPLFASFVKATLEYAEGRQGALAAQKR
ncbi:MAG: CTP synthase [Planctomycetota bacterium]|nr:CTP synthase [Planctomycetota bacterium]